MTETVITKTIQISYPQGRRLIIKRFPTPIEIQIYKYPSSKQIEVSEITSHNELETRFYNEKKSRFIRIITGGVKVIYEEVPPGAYIDIHMTCADDDLRKDINNIVRDLFKKYLKPGICQPGRFTIQARADNCLFTKDTAINFFDEFTNEIRKRTDLYKFEETEKEENNHSKDVYTVYKPKQSFLKRIFGK